MGVNGYYWDVVGIISQKRLINGMHCCCRGSLDITIMLGK